MWYPEVNTNLLGMIDEVRKSQVRYKANQKGEIIEIQPIVPLEQGVYCLRQGDPTLPGSFISNWCFRIGKEVKEKDKQKQFTIDDKAVPPDNGLFLVEKGIPIKLVEHERIIDTPAIMEDATTMPVTTNSSPIV